MLTLILALSLTPAQPQKTPAAQPLAQVQTCVWPHICKQQAQPVAQVQTCVWPHICKQQEETVAQVQTCVWPHICKQADAEGPVTTCQLPNKCG